LIVFLLLLEISDWMRKIQKGNSSSWKFLIICTLDKK
jgi:hypothetical protein